MKKAPEATLTRQELEIMKVVWHLKRATVREIYEEILSHRKIAYTTVLTMMKILTEKGFLKKDTEDRAHVYVAAKPKRRVIGAMVKDFVDRVFNGAAQPLLVHLLSEEKLSHEELCEITELLEKSNAVQRTRR